MSHRERILHLNLTHKITGESWPPPWAGALPRLLGAREHFHQCPRDSPQQATLPLRASVFMICFHNNNNRTKLSFQVIKRITQMMYIKSLQIHQHSTNANLCSLCSSFLPPPWFWRTFDCFTRIKATYKGSGFHSNKNNQRIWSHTHPPAPWGV